MVKKHLKYLEEESISIIRDTYKDAENPVVLYSIGKDSSVLLNLFLKRFEIVINEILLIIFLFSKKFLKILNI